MPDPSNPDGFLLSVIKPRRMSSARVVAAIKRAGHYRKAGHGGTLDPLAEGVLPVAVGSATRMLTFLHACPKSYLGVLLFGVTTSTDDLEGAVLHQSAAMPSPSRIRQAVSGLVGAHDQRPPAYSAVRVGGKRSYRIARTGIEPTLAVRQVTIHDAELLDVDYWDACSLVAAGMEQYAVGAGVRGRLVAAIQVTCSTGTYIRSIARDLGFALGVGACLAGLLRTRVGPFTVASSCTLDETLHAIASGYVGTVAYASDETALHAGGGILGAESARLFGHGMPVSSSAPTGNLRMYNVEGNFLGMGRSDGAGHILPSLVILGSAGQSL